MTPSIPVVTIEKWFKSLSVVSKADGLPARGSTAAALVLLERLRANFILDAEAHLANGGAQIQGLTPTAIRKILARHGEVRVLAKEAGRTNRGTPKVARTLFAAIEPLRLDELSPDMRLTALDEMQAWLVGKFREYFERRRIEFEFAPQLKTLANIRRIMVAAASVKKLPSVSQYLVGAKLQLRFPEEQIENHLASAADNPGGRHGDFEIGDTVFHVTISPGVDVVEKCLRNLGVGKNAVIAVPDAAMLFANNLAEHACPDRINVVSIESYIANNLDELAVYRQSELISGFRRLLDVYNERVNAIEHDKSLMIEIPANLN